MTKHGTVKMWQVGTFLTDSPQEERKTLVTCGEYENLLKYSQRRIAQKDDNVNRLKKRGKLPNLSASDVAS